MKTISDSVKDKNKKSNKSSLHKKKKIKILYKKMKEFKKNKNYWQKNKHKNRK